MPPAPSAVLDSIIPSEGLWTSLVAMLYVRCQTPPAVVFQQSVWRAGPFPSCPQMPMPAPSSCCSWGLGRLQSSSRVLCCVPDWTGVMVTAAFPPLPQGLGRGMCRGQSEGGAGKKNLVSHFLLQCKDFLAPSWGQDTPGCVLWRALGTFHLSLATLWLLSSCPMPSLVLTTRAARLCGTPAPF